MPEDKQTAEARDVKIGELLVAVGIVTTGDLQEAIQIAKRMNLPIGRVIVMSGVISEANLQFVLEAQSLVKDSLLDLDTAVQGLINAFKNQTTLQVALADLRWAPKKDVASNKLGELLMDSNMVTQSQLDSALQTSFDTGMPLGGTLVLQGVLSAQLLPMVLNAQEQIRDGKVSRSQAVENLKDALMFWAKTDDSKLKDGDLGLPGSKALDTSFLVTDPDTPKPAGRRTFQGAPVHHPTAATPEPPPAALAPQTTPNTTMGLVEMMKMAGYCSQQDIDSAIDRALANADIASKLFMATGLLSKASFENFVRCRALMTRGILRPEQAIYALSACRIRGITLEEVFKEMGVSLIGS